MKNKILILGFLAVGIFAGCKQKGEPFEPLNSKRFVKFYGNSKLDEAFDFLQTEDDGFIIVGGRTENYSTDYVGDQQFYVLKVDKYGNKQWDISLGDSLNDQARGVKIASDGNYVVVGTKSFVDYGDTIPPIGDGVQTNMFLVKISTSGDTLWTNDLIGNTSTDEVGNALTELANGDLILVGSTDTEVAGINENGATDQYIVRTDADGNVIDLGQSGGREDDYYNDCFVRVSGGEDRIILLGERVTDNGDKSITITTRKPDQLKNAIDNDPSEGGDYDDIPGRIFDAGDFTLMIGTDGISNSLSATRIISYQFDGKNFDRSGIDETITNSNWENTFGNSVIKAWDGNSFLVLSTGETDGSTNILIDNIANNGQTDPHFVSQEYGLGENRGVKIIRTRDFGYAVLGNTKFGSDQKFILMKLDETGSVE